jgi:hypothetical protein
MAMSAVAAAALGAWSAMLGGSVLRALPVAVAATVLTVLRPSPRTTGALLAGWLPVSVVVAGVPLGRWWPSHWHQLLTDLSDGASRLSTLGVGRIEGDPWPLAVWLLLTGALWITGAAMGAARPLPGPLRTIAFWLLAAPWAVAVALRQTDDVAWQGAVMLFAAFLWFAPRRVPALPVIAWGATAALLAAVTAYSLGPRQPWFALNDVFHRQAQFTTLDTTQTYGPLRGRRSGATMLQVTSPEPALWRMQVLDRFGWRGWEVGLRSRTELPEPAARRLDVEVKVEGLRGNMVVSPGRIQSIGAEGKVTEGQGESGRVTPAPRRGDTYKVSADVVRATPDQLRNAAPPDDPRLRAYTSLWAGSGSYGVVGRFGTVPDGGPGDFRLLGQTPFQPVLDIARQLTAGARTEYETVERVQRYLLDGNRFRYTTDVKRTGRLPLVDFLLYDHAGYCQHFAGAAALLLRMAGVPARVAVGFATGVRTGEGQYTVRDADAHAWIEVYFPGFGWVPFNPTPAAADAVIPRELDPFAPPAGGDRAMSAAGAWEAAAIPLVLVFAVVVVLRRRGRGRRTPLGELLERLARRTGSPVEPSTTLAELRVQLARVGPHSAALVTDAERARFAPGTGEPPGNPRIRIARALAADLGPVRALLVLVSPFRRG